MQRPTHHGGVVLDGSFDRKLGPQCPHEVGGPADLVHGSAEAGFARRIGEHRHAGFDPELCRGVGRGGGDVGELFLIGLGVHGAVAVDENPVLKQHQEHGGDDAGAFAGLHEFERRPDGVRRCVGGAGDHAVDPSQLHHHGAEICAVEHTIAGVDEGYVLVRAEPCVFRGELLAELGGRRVDQGDPGEVDALPGGQLLDLRLGSEHREVADVAAVQDLGGTEDPMSVPSGSTMERRWERARWMSSWRNRRGVMEMARGRARRSSSSCSSTRRDQAPSAAADLRRSPVAISPRTPPTRCAAV
jgi:hypothetical protein